MINQHFSVASLPQDMDINNISLVLYFSLTKPGLKELALIYKGMADRG